MMRHLACLVWVTACSKAPPTESKTSNEPGLVVPGPEVSVELSGVSLADDCGDAVRPPPPQTASAGSSTAPASERISAGGCADPKNCHGPSSAGSAACEPTSMQLSLRSPAGPKPTPIHVKLVEMLDDKDLVIDTLAARKPSRWVDSSYVAWDETIAGGQTLATSYLLSSPSWGKVGGRWNAQGKTFKLRVTITIGGADKTIEKQSIQPIHIEPSVST